MLILTCFMCIWLYTAQGYSLKATLQSNIKRPIFKARNSQQSPLEPRRDSLSTRLYVDPSDTGVNDIIVNGLKFIKIPSSASSGSGPLSVLGETNIYTDIQNVAIILGGITYFVYESRPRGSGRSDLIDIRRSTVPGANSGVFASVFIPKGTVLGSYPGIVARIDDTLSKKKDDEARKRAKKYIWALDDEIVLDPTNAEGLLDLELTYLFGLYKANTILARVNEPPANGDVNVITEVKSSDVSFITERDIQANEELFIDYGNRYDRDDYGDSEDEGSSLVKKQKDLELSEEKRKDESRKMRPIVIDDDLFAETPGEQDTSISGGFLDKLTKSDNKLDKEGILSPEEAAKSFNEYGAGMFKGAEDQDIIKSITGKKLVPLKAEPKDIPSKGDLRSDDDFSEADVAAMQLGEEEILSESASLFGDLSVKKTTKASKSGSPSPSDKILIKSADEGAPKPVAKKKNTVLSPEQAVEIQNKVDSMTDEQLRDLAGKLQITLDSAIMMNMKEKIKESKGFEPKKNLKLPKTPPRDETMRSKYNAELSALEGELEKMYQNPMAVWQELIENPEKYLDEETLKEIDRLNENDINKP